MPCVPERGGSVDAHACTTGLPLTPPFGLSHPAAAPPVERVHPCTYGLRLPRLGRMTHRMPGRSTYAEACA